MQDEHDSCWIDGFGPVTVRRPRVVAEVGELVRQAAAAGHAVYSLGGRTALHVGLPPTRAGIALDLSALDQLIDYPARDMTITVQAGMTVARLQQILAQENQRLPVDVPLPDRATLGGAIAVNASGPQRYGFGTLRDYLIGITVVNDEGQEVKAGGRVVKNVAGYDFCKLLCGSLGTLAILTRLTLKVRPLPESSAFVVCRPSRAADLESLLAKSIDSKVTPSAIEWIRGPVWNDDPILGELTQGPYGALLLGLEGTQPEVAWMVNQARQEWRAQGVEAIETFQGDQAPALWRRLADFASQEDSPLTIKANLVPSALVGFVDRSLESDPECSIAAHAGAGIVIARFRNFDQNDVSTLLVKQLRPLAVASGGNVVIWGARDPRDLTRQAIFGPDRDEMSVMRAVKSRFDPKGILNPGRFVYGPI